LFNHLDTLLKAQKILCQRVTEYLAEDKEWAHFRAKNNPTMKQEYAATLNAVKATIYHVYNLKTLQGYPKESDLPELVSRIRNSMSK
jgi:hypothetical protein